MSFDIFFLDRADGQSWEEAMDALEQAAADDETPMTEAQLATWEKVRAAFLAVIPDAEESAGESFRELSHEQTGIQLSSFGAELSLSVPYWHRGPESERVVDLLTQVATRIEAATGLVAYDPQGDDAFLGGGEATAAETMDRTHDAMSEPKPRSFWSRLFGR